MKIDVAFLPSLIKKERFTNDTCIVLDIFRASGSIITAGMNGCKQITPLLTIEDAKILAESKPAALLAGERKSIKIEGFHFGNSPREFIADKVNNKEIIMTTSNGTRAIKSTNDNITFIGGFLNANAICQKALSLQQNILIICAGTENDFSLEDALCAGYMVNIIQEQHHQVALTDSALASLLLFAQAKDTLLQTATNSKNGQRLADLGLYEDMEYCFQINITNIIPEYKNNIITFQQLQ